MTFLAVPVPPLLVRTVKPIGLPELTEGASGVFCTLSLGGFAVIVAVAMAVPLSVDVAVAVLVMVPVLAALVVLER